MEEKTNPAACDESEEHRRLKLARAIYEEQTGPWHKIMEGTRHYPGAAVTIGIGLGVLAGLLARRR